MVHALRKTHRLLNKGGLLIEGHDEPVSPSLSLEFQDEIIEVGLLHDSARFQEVRQANEAVEQVINSRLFERVDFQVLPYLIFIDSLESFDDWLSRQWDTTFLESATENYIRESIGINGSARRIIVSRVGQISYLRSR